MRAHRRTVAGLALGGLLALALIVGVSAGAAARASANAARSAKISASLSETPFAPSETDSVRLIYRFSGRSYGFTYRLSLKKKSTWLWLRSATRKGSFSGTRSMGVTKLFNHKKVALGRYRLELSTGTSRTTIYFDVVKAVKTTTVRVSAGDTHSCALISSGTVKCWGDNSKGQLGNLSTTDSTTPVATKVNSNAKTVTSGTFTTCALISGGKVRCWGDNSYGQLGAGRYPSVFSAVPILVSGIAHAVAVSSGADHSCALFAGGTVRCWGRNNSGDIGSSKSYSAVPVTVPGITGAIAISAGYRHSCALLESGKVVCWGNNQLGELGNGKTSSSKKPAAVKGVTKAIAVSAGNDHSCAVLSNHTIMCWGRADSGALGDGSTAHGHTDKNGIDFSSTPVKAKGITTATAVSAGSGFTCARLSSGQINCWGSNNGGELGNGTTSSSTTPVAVSGITAAVAISASAGSGSNDHACALLSSGKVTCWGKNNHGQLGNSGQSYSPTPLASSVANATRLAAGDTYSCALLAGGTVACWGNNANGQLGDGTTTSSSTPVTVRAVGGIGDLSGVTAIGVGYQHSCALLAGGTVACWGNNANGQLGDGTTTSSSTSVTVKAVGGIGDLASVVTIGVGYQHSCASLIGGTMECWGNNANGQLGDGTTTSSSTPVTVKAVGGAGDLASVMTIGVGYQHSCALLTSGAIDCWGANVNGQLGDGTTTSSPMPVTVKAVGGAGNLSGVTAIGAGYQHTCALLTGGKVDCWGSSANGQLGNAASSDRSTPVTVNGVGGIGDLSGATAVSTGYQHTCALITGGTVDCWGDNSKGELGVGVLDYSSTAVEVAGLP